MIKRDEQKQSLRQKAYIILQTQSACLHFKGVGRATLSFVTSQFTITIISIQASSLILHFQLNDSCRKLRRCRRETPRKSTIYPPILPYRSVQSNLIYSFVSQMVTGRLMEMLALASLSWISPVLIYPTPEGKSTDKCLVKLLMNNFSHNLVQIIIRVILTVFII